MLLALVLWAVCRVVALVYYLQATGSLRLELDPARLRTQLAYALPFGFGIVVGVTADNLHQYVVSFFYDTREFALYSVGYLQVPLVGIAFQSVADVALVRLTTLWMERRIHDCVQLMQETILRLSMFLFPLWIWLFVSAHDLIVVLFTTRFEPSIAIFRVFILLVPLTSLTVDYALRSFSDTIFHLKASMVRLFAGVLLLVALVPAFGLEGAAWATVSSVAIMRSLMFHRVGQWLKVGASQLLPWNGLGRILLVSVVAGATAYLVHIAPMHNQVIRLILSFAVFASSYAILIWTIGPITYHQKRRIKTLVHRIAKNPFQSLGTGR